MAAQDLASHELLHTVAPAQTLLHIGFCTLWSLHRLPHLAPVHVRSRQLHTITTQPSTAFSCAAASAQSQASEPACWLLYLQQIGGQGNGRAPV